MQTIKKHKTSRKHTLKHTTTTRKPKVSKLGKSGKGIRQPKLLVVRCNKTAQLARDRMKNGNILILYYAEWCPACQDFKPEWTKFKELASKRNDLPIIAEVESSHVNLVPNDTVTGFPTVLYYGDKVKSPSSTSSILDIFNTTSDNNNTNNNRSETYTGNRNANALLEYLLNKQNKSMTPSTADNNTKQNMHGGQTLQTHKSKSKSNNKIFDLLTKKGLSRKTANSKQFKTQFNMLERASKLSANTFKSIKSSLGLKK